MSSQMYHRIWLEEYSIKILFGRVLINDISLSDRALSVFYLSPFPAWEKHFKDTSGTVSRSGCLIEIKTPSGMGTSRKIYRRGSLYGGDKCYNWFDKRKEKRARNRRPRNLYWWKRYLLQARVTNVRLVSHCELKMHPMDIYKSSPFVCPT